MDSKKILVVEDDSSMRRVLIDKFKSEGLTVYEAENGEDGLKVALAEHPDIIIADVIMPKMGGIEMLSRLRADSWGRNVEVVILTNIDDIGVVSRAMEFGGLQYLVKAHTSIDNIFRVVKFRLKI